MLLSQPLPLFYEEGGSLFVAGQSIRAIETSQGVVSLHWAAMSSQIARRCVFWPASESMEIFLMHSASPLRASHSTERPDVVFRPLQVHTYIKWFALLSFSFSILC